MKTKFYIKSMDTKHIHMDTNQMTIVGYRIRHPSTEKWKPSSPIG